MDTVVTIAALYLNTTFFIGNAVDSKIQANNMKNHMLDAIFFMVIPFSWRKKKH